LVTKPNVLSTFMVAKHVHIVCKVQPLKDRQTSSSTVSLGSGWAIKASMGCAAV
jgi:hypothetical protein